MTTTPDTSKPPGQRSAEEVIERAAGTEGKYRCVAADTMGEFAAPSPEQIGRGVEAISGMLAAGGAAVHCGCSVGRTGTLLACYLAARTAQHLRSITVIMSLTS